MGVKDVGREVFIPVACGMRGIVDKNMGIPNVLDGLVEDANRYVRLREVGFNGECTNAEGTKFVDQCIWSFLIGTVGLGMIIRLPVREHDVNLLSGQGTTNRSADPLPTTRPRNEGTFAV